MKKKWTLLVLISVFVLALTACQQGGDQKAASHKTTEQKETEPKKITDPKQLFTTAYTNTQNAKTFDVSTDIDINIDPSSVKEKYKKFIEAINSAKLKADVKGNTETKQYEVVLKGKFSYKGLSMNINLPTYIDENKQLCYVKVDGMIKSFGFILEAKGINLESIKDKYIEAPIEYDKQLTSQKTEELKQKSLETLEKIDLPKDNFKKEELTEKEKQQGAAHKITLSFSDENIKALFINFVNALGEAMNKPLPDNMMTQLKNGLKKINFKKLDFAATIDDKNTFQNFNANILINVGQLENSNFAGDIGLKLSTTYNNVNGDITFKYKPNENQIVTQAELKELLMQRNYN
ncbi:hypothetical protein HOO54_12660 [Bacillus sp. WMMC1349]|uniref:hypothetical protein n=1 Tax=Bacillus sp. WMMC1349 TaxID=2736254 RepID=UPI0015574AB2|nr:hypothetical protein [Bacillus sp. WMMC1349]NPC93060.1 hypothetical protein [Bacillus sp. WMMC1349]